MEMSKLNSNHGFISLLYSIGENPLGLWSKTVSTNGCVRRVEDDKLNGDRVIEITGPDDCPMPTNISCPNSPEDFLNIRLPVLAIVLRDLNDQVQIAFQLIDEENIRRKFILSTRENEKTRSVDTARISLKLDDGWNLLEIDLRNLCRTTYRTEYQALQRLIIYPNCRVRRIYFQDRHYEINETPVELCQAFFDMYMLKWGIHFVERSCQTNETLKEIKNEKKESISVPENRHSVGKSKTPKSLTSDKLSSTAKFRRASTIKKPTKKKPNSVDNNAIFTNEKNAKSSQPLIRKKKKSNDKIHEEANFRETTSIPIIVNDNSKKTETEGEIFRKWPYNYVPLRKIDDVNAKTKDSIVFKSFDVKLFAERKSMSNRLSTVWPTPIATIPSVVETEADEAVRNVESTRSKLLTTDEAVGKFLELRHVINEKMLENYRDRGFTMTEVELSIYNSKNRRNSYGQGKLVEKHGIRVDKACNFVSNE